MPKSIKFIKNILIFVAITVLVIAFILPINSYSAKSVCLTIVAKDKTYTFSGLEIGRYNNSYYLKNASSIVDGIYLDTVIREKDASITFNPNNSNPFYITKERNGYEFNKEELLKEIDIALNNSIDKINAEFKPIIPKITEELLKQESNYRVAFTTYYTSSTNERKHNIKLASSKINGTILQNGEEFSFNKKVGIRSEENGFLPAKIIYNGDFVEGVGGGVCQVSTTLYNASLLCGLKIVEHHPHSLNVNYVEPSFDAMVNSFSSDLRFINNSGGRIYISSIADDNKIKITFYGLKQNETYERVSVTTEQTEYLEYVYEEDETLPLGSSVTVRQPKGSIKSEGYLIKYVDGKRVSNVKIRSDNYGSIKGIIKIPKNQ